MSERESVREQAGRRSRTRTRASVASRRASGARRERSERRREGYPPEGPRPRSGLGRVARSRSDAPGFNEWSGESESIIGSAAMSIGIGISVRVRASISVDSSVSVGCRRARFHRRRCRGWCPGPRGPRRDPRWRGDRVRPLRGLLRTVRGSRRCPTMPSRSGFASD